MSTQQHTPGPWSIDLGNIGIDMKNHVSVDAPNHSGIANVVWVMEEDALMGKNSPRCEANAYLIGAAPDLLKALRELLVACKGASFASDPFDAVPNAIAAVAKATGGQA